MDYSEEQDDAGYSVQVGERLRAIRKQKRLSLHDVEAQSQQEFKASVLGAYERGEAEETRLRAALDAMLATPPGIKAAGRLGTASVRYPSRGEGGAKLARDMREKGGGDRDAGGGGDAVMGSGGKVAAVQMLKAGKSEMGAMGAAPGGARGKKRRKGGLAGGTRG